MTDRDTERAEAPTIPPPAEPDHVRVYRLGRALDSLDIVGDFIRGEIRGDLADELNRAAKQERERRTEFESRIEAKIDKLLGMVTGQSDELLKYAARVVAVEFRQREHEHGNVHCAGAECEFRKLSQGLKGSE